MEEGLSLKGNGRFGGCLKKGIKEEWDSNTEGGVAGGIMRQISGMKKQHLRFSSLK